MPKWCLRDIWRRKTGLGGRKVPNNPLLSLDFTISGNTFSPGAKLTTLNQAQKNVDRIRVSQNVIFPAGGTAAWRISEPRKRSEGWSLSHHPAVLGRGSKVSPLCWRMGEVEWRDQERRHIQHGMAENRQQERWSLPSHPHPPGRKRSFIPA